MVHTLGTLSPSFRLPPHRFRPRGACSIRYQVLNALETTVRRVGNQALMLAASHHSLPPLFPVLHCAMISTLERLRSFPMSHRDVVLQTTQCKRMALNLLGMISYYSHFQPCMYQRQKPFPVDHSILGCFTFNATILEEMFYAGVPIYFLRPPARLSPTSLRVKHIVDSFLVPTHIVTDEWIDPKTRVTCPCKTLLTSVPCTRRHIMSRPLGRYYEDLEALPLEEQSLVLDRAPTPLPPLSFTPPPPSPPPTHNVLSAPLSCTPPEPSPVQSTSLSVPFTHPLPIKPLQAVLQASGVVKRTRREKKAALPSHTCSLIASHFLPSSLLFPATTRPPAPPSTVVQRADCCLANHNKWLPLYASLMPHPCPEWFTALALVKRRHCPDFRLPKSIADLMYPDTAYLAVATEEKRAAIIAIWLSIRTDRCAQMQHPTAQWAPHLPVARPAVWRAFFSLYLHHPLDADRVRYLPTEGLHTCSDISRTEAVDAARSMFGPKIMQAMKQQLRQVEWYGTVLPVVNGLATNLTDAIVRDIIWELQELEWRYEVFALDRIAAACKWLEDDADIIRTAMVSRVYSPINTFVLLGHPFPEVTPHIASEHRCQCITALQALLELMHDWPECPEDIRTGTFIVDNILNMEVPHLADLEQQVMLFYSQLFVDYFDRPPVLLHRLPPR